MERQKFSALKFLVTFFFKQTGTLMILFRNLTDTFFKFRCDLSQPRNEISVQKISSSRFRSSVILYEALTKNLIFQFRRADGFVEEFGVNFPCYSILGEKRVLLEFYFPEQVTRLWGNEFLLTPVLFIHQERHVPFLRKVKVTLPFDSRLLRTGDSLEVENVNTKKNVVVKQDRFEVDSFSFSPVGAAAQQPDSGTRVSKFLLDFTSFSYKFKSENFLKKNMFQP